MQYPNRQKFFANKYTRLMLATCAAQELGSYAMLMCLAVVNYEDHMRYSKAIGFYNDQLLSILGIARWESLNKARNTAVSKGWLHYESQGKRKEGLYWVTVPQIHQESFNSLSLDISYRGPPLSLPDSVYDSDKDSVNRSVNDSEPPTLSLYPIPCPILDETRPETTTTTPELTGKEKIRLRSKFNRYLFLHGSTPAKTIENDSQFLDIIREFGEDAAFDVARSEWESKIESGSTPTNAKLFTNQLDAILASRAIHVAPTPKPTGSDKVNNILKQLSGRAIWEELGSEKSTEIARRFGYSNEKISEIAFNLWYSSALEQDPELRVVVKQALTKHFEGQH